jgi:hypothetical protein
VVANGYPTAIATAIAAIFFDVETRADLSWHLVYVAKDLKYMKQNFVRQVDEVKRRGAAQISLRHILGRR